TLDAGEIVFGEFKVDEGTAALKAPIKLTIRVIDLRKLQQKAEFTQSGTLDGLSQMETRLAWLLLRQLAPERAPSEEVFFHDRAPVRVEAMESYVRALMAATDDQKLKLFTQAAKLDDHFSQPNFRLGRMMLAKKDYKAAGDWLAKVSRSDSHFL